MRYFEAINTVVLFEKFAVTGGIAAALIVWILVSNRSSLGYSRPLRAIVSAIGALGFAPAFYFSEGVYAVFPAFHGLFQALEGPRDGAVLLALRIGGLPLFIAYFLIYEVWKLCAKPRAQE